MATIIAAVPTPTISRTAPPQGTTTGISSPVLGLPQIGTKRGGRVRCSSSEAKKPSPMSGAASLLLSAASMMSNPVLALVDERMSTEGTGLSLGISNNLLGWILIGVFGLIWALFFVYTSTLEEDDESGLSL